MILTYTSHIDHNHFKLEIIVMSLPSRSSSLKHDRVRLIQSFVSCQPGDSTRNNIKGHYGLEVESHSQNSPFLAHDENSPESIRHSPAIDKHHNKGTCIGFSLSMEVFQQLPSCHFFTLKSRLGLDLG